MTGALGPSGGDVITAVLLQITQQAERLATLEQREATHHSETAATQEALRDSLSRLDQQITAIADRLTDFIARGETASDVDDEHGVRVQAPRWWRLDGDEREKAIARLAPGSNRYTGRATGTSRRHWGHAGQSTRCACSGCTG